MKIMVNGVTILLLFKRTSSKSVLCGHAKDSLIDLPHTYDLGYIEHYYKKHYWAPLRFLLYFTSFALVVLASSYSHSKLSFSDSLAPLSLLDALNIRHYGLRHWTY
jgi:hypothetical protein